MIVADQVQVASKTNDVAGDGTTTATVLARPVLGLRKKRYVVQYRKTRRHLQRRLQGETCTFRGVSREEKVDMVCIYSSKGRFVGRCLQAVAAGMNPWGTQIKLTQKRSLRKGSTKL